MKHFYLRWLLPAIALMLVSGKATAQEVYQDDTLFYAMIDASSFIEDWCYDYSDNLDQVKGEIEDAVSEIGLEDYASAPSESLVANFFVELVEQFSEGLNSEEDEEQEYYEELCGRIIDDYEYILVVCGINKEDEKIDVSKSFELTIPNEVEDENGIVIAVIDSAFSGYTTLTSVTMGDNVVSIGDGAFSGCTGLTGVTLDDNLASIGDGAFSGCTGLTGVTMGDNVTAIGDDAFSGCTGLTDLTLPAQVTEYAYSKYFSDCDSLASVSITGSGEIGTYAFHNCSTMTSLTIGDGMTRIGMYAFASCTGLDSLTLDLSDVTYIGHSAFYQVGLDSVTLGNKLDSLCEYAFRETDLVNVTLPTSLTYLGRDAFSYCDSLRKVNIPTGVTKINQVTFYSCDNLSDVTFHDNITYIGSQAFELTNITNVSLPAVEEIGEAAFRSCPLTTLLIGDSVQTIGKYAFSGCTELTDLTLPAQVTEYVYSNYFSDCRSLASVSITGSGEIGESAFYNCTTLTTLTIGDDVTAIGDSAFGYCTSLEGFDIPDNVTSIGEAAFKGCTSLDVMVIHEGITSIGEDCFDNCESLDTLWFYPKEPPFTSTTDTLTGAYAYLNIYVPTYSTDDYRATSTLYPYTNAANDSSYSTRVLPFEEVTISDVGVATIALPFRAVIQSDWDGFGVYTLDSLKSNTDTLYANEINYNETASRSLADDTPAYIVAPAGTYRLRGSINFNETITDSTVTSSAGYLCGNYRTGQYAPVGSYVLQNQPEKDGLAFYKVYQENYSPLRQFSAYLVLDSVSTSNARSVTVIFDDNVQDTDDSETTGIANISGVNTATGDGNIYNLQGIRMNSGNLPKGIYIRNGKKFIVR